MTINHMTVECEWLIKAISFIVTNPEPVYCDVQSSPLSEMTMTWDSSSQVMGRRFGSTQTSWQTSVIKLALKCLTSLCQMVKKLHVPLGQDMACSTEKLSLHARVDVTKERCQPYYKEITSLKAPLWRVKPYSGRGKEVSQLDTSFLFSKVQGAVESMG